VLQVTDKENEGDAVLAVNVTPKGALPSRCTVLTRQNKRRLVYHVAAIIAAEKNFVQLFKSFIANVLKCDLNAHVLLSIPK